MYAPRSLVMLGLAIAFSIASTDAQAQQYTGTITDSECTVVASSKSPAGAVGGSIVGGVAGAVIGDALFGRSGRALGSLIGSGGGAVVGENLGASKQYRCVVTVEVNTVGRIYTETYGPARNIGQTIVLVKTTDGRWISK